MICGSFFMLTPVTSCREEFINVIFNNKSYEFFLTNLKIV